MSHAEPLQVPLGQTALRLEWQFLPPEIRRIIEAQLGSPVVDAKSQDSGFTPGFASVLTCADGSRHFVKAASAVAQQAFANSYREEARKLAALPENVPAPRLLWSMDEDWVVLETEYVAGRAPHRPWRIDELDDVLDTVEVSTRALTPPPAGLKLGTFAEEFGSMAESWAQIGDRTRYRQAHDAEQLARTVTDFGVGDSLVHTDIRDDNVILGPDGQVWICDWNWPVIGAAWLDTLFVLVQARGDGLDADAILATRSLTAEVPAEHIDGALALLAGYFIHQAEQPVPAYSPHLGSHRVWMRNVIWGWLCERRGWQDEGAPVRAHQ